MKMFELIMGFSLVELYTYVPFPFETILRFCKLYVLPSLAVEIGDILLDILVYV